MIRVVLPGSGSIPDPGSMVKKAPDPGSGSATLFSTVLLFRAFLSEMGILLLIYHVRMERGVCSDSCCQCPDAAHQRRQAGQRHQQGQDQLT